MSVIKVSLIDIYGNVRRINVSHTDDPIILVHNVEHEHYGCERRVLWALPGWVKY